MALVLVNRSFSTSLTSAVWRHNVSLRYVALLVLLACALIFMLEPLRQVLDFAPLKLTDLALLILMPACVLFLCELLKGRMGWSARRAARAD